MKPALFLLTCGASVLCALPADQVKTVAGVLEGTVAPASTVRVFKGVPFAAPPVGDLRWRSPEPVAKWGGVRKADAWGPRCLQGKIFGDMVFREQGMGEDCLYLNIWTPVKAASKPLPVFVWYHGGGFAAGSGSEPRYDGEALARLGVVVVNVNYRLGIFGFFAHPELTRESSHGASGNYGLLDQVEALRWVRANIAGFGGDPGRVTIGGESAGSFSVSALMASPLTKGLIQGAIGESGAFLSGPGGTLEPKSLKDAEADGAKFAAAIGAPTLAELRAKKAEDLLAELSKGGPRGFGPIIDGWCLPENPAQVYAAGAQAHVPLLAGWNSSEMGMAVAMNPQKPTAASFPALLATRFKDQAGAALKVYQAGTDEEAQQSAADLFSDQFIGHGTWKWIEEQVRTGKAPVYRFQFDRFLPEASGSNRFGASHAAEIEYVFSTLDSKPAQWQSEDRRTAAATTAYWANFIKNGDPNGPGLARWPEFGKTHQVMHLDANPKAAPEAHRERHLFLESLKP